MPGGSLRLASSTSASDSHGASPENTYTLHRSGLSTAFFRHAAALEPLIPALVAMSTTPLGTPSALFM